MKLTVTKRLIVGALVFVVIALQLAKSALRN